MSYPDKHQEKNLEYYKELIDHQYESSITADLTTYTKYSIFPLVIINFSLVYITISDLLNFPNKHKIQKYVVVLSLISMILSMVSPCLKYFVNEKYLLSTRAIFFNFLLTIPFQIISGILSTSLSHSGDPVIIVFSVEILIRYCIVIFYFHDFKSNLVSGIVNVVYHWISSYMFHSKLNSTVFCYLVINTITNFTMTLFIYFYDLKTKESFRLSQFFKYEWEYFLNIFDEMKKGIVIINHSEILLYNNYMIKLAKVLDKNDVESLIHEKIKILNFLKILLKNFENINESTPDKLTKFLKNVETSEINFDKMQSIIEENNIYSENFVNLGTIKIINKNDEDMFFNVNLRYRNKIELLILDITNTCKLESAKALYRYKSLYLAKIAHEFKNPLLTIISLCNNTNFNLENMTRKNENNRKCFIESLCNYLIFLIENLNYFSQEKNRKKSSVDKKPDEYEVSKALDFSCLIFEIRKENDEKKNNIKIIKNYPEILPHVYMPETRLKQVIINLLSNSYKFTFAGEIKVSVKPVIMENGYFLRFTIKDTGIGIPLNYQKSLLDLEKVVAENESFNQFGSGFGLKIIKEILEEYESKLMFTSKVNIGSKFWFDLEFKDENYFNNDPANDSVYIDSTKSNETLIQTNLNFFKVKDFNEKYLNLYSDNCSKNENEIFDFTEEIVKSNDFENKLKDPLETRIINADFNKKCIVICDDEKFIRRSLRSLVEQIGYKLNYDIEIEEANNGVEALYLICENASIRKPTHALMIDETMPFMSGSQCISNLKLMMDMKLLNHIKICSITSYLDQDNIDRIKRSGCDTIIIKPPNEKNIEIFLKNL